MLETIQHLIHLASTQGVIAVVLLLLAISNVLNIFLIYKYLAMKNSKQTQNNENDINHAEKIHKSIEGLREEINKHNNLYHEIHNKLMELNSQVTNLMDTLEKSESSGSISQIKQNIEKIKESLLELKTIVSLFVSKGG